MTLNTNIIKTRYNSRSPGKYWIKVSDANKLRDKALENQLDMLNKEWEIELKGLLKKKCNVINKRIQVKKNG